MRTPCSIPHPIKCAKLKSLFPSCPLLSAIKIVPECEFTPLRSPVHLDGQAAYTRWEENCNRAAAQAECFGIERITNCATTERRSRNWLQAASDCRDRTVRSSRRCCLTHRFPYSVGCC